MSVDRVQPLVLASASPRRAALLTRIGVVPLAVHPANIEETPRPSELPRALVVRLAREKAMTVAVHHPGVVVLGADTVVVVGRHVLPKTDDEASARRCLALLSGRRHHVLTAIAVIDPAGRLRERVSDTVVTFKPLTAAEIDRYLATGEWLGKAGGYAVQGYAEAFVRSLSGSHSGVIGLPLYETRSLLIASGLALA